jgi:hypothetical protein
MISHILRNSEELCASVDLRIMLQHTGDIQQVLQRFLRLQLSTA